ncbi:hypothetical protein V1290_000273 [Bradyrhizobium sp. AZCC 1578]|uniref:DUF1236 domain-containing protein n=1 Tax=Bradyrhizobium sp. AZCC 1578 TaxID=3117027 RepID=UPI002FF390FA
MTKGFLISVAAAALIAGTGFANAQGTGMGRESPSGGAAAQQGGATEQKSDMKSEQKSMGAEKSQRTEDKGGKDMKAEGREDKGMKAEGKEDRGGMKAEQKGDREKTTGQGTPRDQGRDQSTTQQRDQSTTQGREQTTPQKDQKAQGKEDRMQTQTQGGAAGQDTTTTGQAGAAGKLSTEQRTQITSAIKETRVEPVTNVNFSISVGTKVPRDVTFHTLPERVVTIYPEWRRYKYILVKEQIVIVDPNTYEIVAVLEA